jgi:putative Mn2+ efflux pump MntP
MAKVLGVALAVGLDVLAVSVGVGVMQLTLSERLRLGFAFAGSEIAMQVVGYELGAGAGKVFGEVATYVGLVLLATVGCLMIRNSLRRRSNPEFDATHASSEAAG